MLTHLHHLDVGAGRTVGALTLFPVWPEVPQVAGINWDLASLQISETPTGDVNTLLVRNQSSRPAMVLEGDLLVGGWQHRMASASTLVPASMPPEYPLLLDVVCVEHGRWSGENSHRVVGARGSFVVRQSNRRYRDTGNRDAAQHAVWQRIARFDASLHPSPTSSMLDHLETLTDVPVRPMPGQRGVVLGIGGEIMGLELFGSVIALKARWGGLLRAAALDARFAPEIATSASAARQFVRTLENVSLDGHPAEAASQYTARVGSIRVNALGRSRDASPLHLTAFDDTHPLALAA